MRARPVIAFGQLAQQGGQRNLDQGVGPQLHQQGAHLGQRATGELAHFLQPAPALGGVHLPDVGQHVGDQGGGEEGLRHRVVQVAGQAGALGDHGVLRGLFAQALVGWLNSSVRSAMRCSSWRRYSASCAASRS